MNEAIPAQPDEHPLFQQPRRGMQAVIGVDEAIVTAAQAARSGVTSAGVSTRFHQPSGHLSDQYAAALNASGRDHAVTS